MPRYPENITYSDRYQDDEFEYRNATLTKQLYSKVKTYHGKLLKETEWRALGVQGS